MVTSPKCLQSTDCVVAQLDKLTKFSFRTIYGNQQWPLQQFLGTSKSSESVEELDLVCPLEDVLRFRNAVTRFTNLKQLSISFSFLDELNDGDLSFLHRLDKLRVLTLTGRKYITGDGLVNLVRHLPDLELLCLHLVDTVPRTITLKETTFARICEIYRTRKQKMEIYNCDISDELYKNYPHEEPFAEDNQQESVRFIFVDPHNLGQRFGYAEYKYI